MVDGNFMLMPTYRLVTIQGFDGFDASLIVFCLGRNYGWRITGSR